MYSNIFLYKNDEKVQNFFNNINETFKINHEEILLANIFYNRFKLHEIFRFTNKIPNFI